MRENAAHRRQRWLAAILAGVCAATVAAAHEPPGAAAQATAAFDYPAPEPGSYDLPALGPAADGPVLDVGGRQHRLKELMAGKVAVLSLIYTGCETACPEATATLYDLFYASAGDRELAEQVTLISLSFDPDRDTPAAMAAYGAAALADPGGKSRWHFLTTASRRQLEPILAGYGQAVDARPPGGPADQALLSHLLRVYLIDRSGQVRNIYGLGFLDPRLLMADVRTLLVEERRQGR